MQKIGKTIAVGIVLMISGAALAQRVKIEKARAKEAPAAPEPSRVTRTPVIVAAFGVESYRRFLEPGFEVKQRPPNREAPYLSIEMSAPTSDGFGGSCVERRGSPVDLSGHRFMDVDLEAFNPEHVLQIKLERTESVGPDMQIRPHDGRLPQAGRQVLTLALPERSTVLRVVQRVCFAMEASGFRGPTGHNAIRIYSVHFR